MANKPNTESSSITLFLCGDVMTGRGIDQVLPHSVDPVLYEDFVKDARKYVYLAEQENGEIPQAVSYDYIWGDAMEVWHRLAPDARIINLETAVTDHDEPWPQKGINYRMHPKNVELLITAGIDFCSLANNHTLDWQREGLAQTIDVLDKAGIGHAGAGNALTAASQPAVIETANGRVIVLSYGMETSGIPVDWQATTHRSGVNFLPNLSAASVDQIVEQVMTVRQPGDIVLVSIHWGGNWGYEVPRAWQRFAHELIDRAAVDIIHGHSSHHPKGLEVYRNKLIIYGAGDFINDYEGIGGHDQYRDDLTLMYFPILDPSTGQLQSLKMVPLQVRKFSLHQASPKDVQWLYKVMKRESGKLGTDVQMNGEGEMVVE